MNYDVFVSGILVFIGVLKLWGWGWAWLVVGILFYLPCVYEELRR